MNMFTVIDDGVAILRAPKGVYRQAKVYQRGGRVFVAYGSGFLRVTSKFGETWGTSHPDVKVEALEGMGIASEGNGEPRFEG